MSDLSETDVRAVNRALDAEFGDGYTEVRDQQRKLLQAATDQLADVVRDLAADGTSSDREEKLTSAVGALLMVVGTQNVRLEALETRVTFGPS